MTSLRFIIVLLLSALTYGSFSAFEAYTKSLGLDSTINPKDREYIQKALHLASRAVGQTAPNPCVGCVLVNDQDEIVGQGWHERSGEPHAEAIALGRAGDRARGCTAYVTLEPCNHYGRTPPCTLALARSGLKRVVAGMVDPDPRVSGQGLQVLQAQGIAVQLIGDEEHELCKEVNAAFVYRTLHRRPYLTYLAGLDIACHALDKLGEERTGCLDCIQGLLEEDVRDMDSLLLEEETLLHYAQASFSSSFALYLHHILPKHIQVVLYSQTALSERARGFVRDWARGGREVWRVEGKGRVDPSFLSFIASPSSTVPSDAISGVFQARLVEGGEIEWEERRGVGGSNGLLCLPLPPHNLFFTALNNDHAPSLPISPPGGLQRLVSLGFGEDSEEGRGDDEEDIGGEIGEGDGKEERERGRSSRFLASLLKTVNTQAKRVRAQGRWVRWTAMTMRLWSPRRSSGTDSASNDNISSEGGGVGKAESSE